jgi:single-strand DNA-binding protein
MLQEIEIIGYLGGDPEMRFTVKGKAITHFSVAVSDYDDSTAWFRVTAWESQAEACKEYLHKGSLVFVKGKLSFDKDTGGPTIFSRKDGTSGASFEISANKIKFLDRPDGEKKPQKQQAKKPPWK